VRISNNEHSKSNTHEISPIDEMTNLLWSLCADTDVNILSLCANFEKAECEASRHFEQCEKSLTLNIIIVMAVRFSCRLNDEQ
jgi:hypothetical protein